MIKIQLVDDEPHVLSALKRVLYPHRWEVHVFSDAQVALDALTEHEYAVIISDYKMPNLDGITFLQFAKQRQPYALRMVLSAHGDRQSMLQAINRAEIYRFLSKPWEDYEIDTAVCACVDLYLLRRENHRLLSQIRKQQTALERQKDELIRLEAEYPGITRVERDTDGAVLIELDERTDHG